MPELAEVETFSSQLNDVLTGNTISDIELFHDRTTRRHEDKEEFRLRIKGNKVEKITRHGKYLTMHLSNGDQLNMHLRMSGRFLAFDSQSFDLKDLPKHSHLILHTDNTVIAFIDPRTFGEFWITESSAKETLKGVDALESKKSLLSKLNSNRTSKRRVKAILLDQVIIAGIGNIYADEICAYAKIRPTKEFCDLTDSQIINLVNAIQLVLKKAVKKRGSSLRDESFKDLYGRIGEFQNYHLVHARKKCSICDSDIIKTKVAGRTTYFCPNCQH